MRRRLIVAWLFVVAACGTSSPAPAPSPAPASQTPTVFTLTGTVTDGTSRGVLPNAGIQVMLGANAGRATKTDSAGKYSLSGLSSGTLFVGASATGYVTTILPVNVTANTVLDFDLSRLASPAPVPPAPSSHGPTR